MLIKPAFWMLLLAAVTVSVSATNFALAQTRDEFLQADRSVTQMFRAGHYREAIPTAQRALAIAERLYGPDHLDVAATLNGLGILYRLTAAYGAAELAMKRAIAIRETKLAANDPLIALSLDNLSGLYLLQSRYGEAEVMQTRALAIREKALGANHVLVAHSLNNIAYRQTMQGYHANAAQSLQRALAIHELAPEGERSDLATILSNLAEAHQALAQFAEAEPLLKRAIALNEKEFGAHHGVLAYPFNNLGMLYLNQARFSEAEGPLKRALDIWEKSLGLEHPLVATALTNLGELYRTQSLFAKAEPLYQRALVIREQVQGSMHPDVANSLHNLAGLYLLQERYTEAEPRYQRAIHIFEVALGVEHENVASSLHDLAALYQVQRRFEEAEPLKRRSLQIFQAALGAEHPKVARALDNLSMLFQAQGRYQEAGALREQALAIFRKSLGVDHTEVGLVLQNFATLHFQQQNWQQAFDYGRQSTDMVVRRTQRTTTVAGPAFTRTTKGETETEAHRFKRLIKAAYRLPQLEGERMSSDMFVAAQWSQSSAAAASLAQMAARGANGDLRLAADIRERQDLASEWHNLDGLRTAAVSLPSEKRNAKSETATVARMAKIDTRIAEIDKRTKENFPDYATLTSPEPLSIQAVQAILNADEALILCLDTPQWNPTPEESFIWVVTKTKAQWIRSEFGTKALVDKVNLLRRSLDPTQGGIRAALAISGVQSRASGFDHAVAYELYEALLAPAEDIIRDKKHLLIVPSGPLTALPFHVLVTNPPNSMLPTATAESPWLVRRHAITTLPSVASLKSLRGGMVARSARQNFIAFADPVFRSVEIAAASPASADPEASYGLSVYFRGATADAQSLANLARLPDTADEVRAIAALFQGGTQLRIGRDATETEVKKLPLDQYRIVHFATHGLVAGEIKGLAEPALALSVPSTPTPEDDGLLTASEVAGLKLNAEWVILSACNTAAGDRPGAEALSGLARAFFYAGTKALLVSHWPVKSAATVKLTTRTFEALAREPGIGRAEALRRAMLAMINAGGADAHPSSWAPFVVVGEGGAGR
jgi:CHAT domain-containing protein